MNPEQNAPENNSSAPKSDIYTSWLSLPSVEAAEARGGRIVTIFLRGTCSNSDDYQDYDRYYMGELISTLCKNHELAGGEKYVSYISVDGPGSGDKDYKDRFVDPGNYPEWLQKILAYGRYEALAHVLAVLKGERTWRPDDTPVTPEEKLLLDRLSKLPIIKVNIIGWSRGGAHAILLAHLMANDSLLRHILVSIFSVEPVPGLLLSNSQFVTLPTNVIEYNGAYAINEYSGGFNPVIPKAQDPSITQVILYFLNGHHSTLVGNCQWRKKGKFIENYDLTAASKITRDLLEKFLTRQGTLLVNMLNCTERELLNLYTHMVKNLDGYRLMEKEVYIYSQWIGNSRYITDGSYYPITLTLKDHFSPAEIKSRNDGYINSHHEYLEKFIKAQESNQPTDNIEIDQQAHRAQLGQLAHNRSIAKPINLKEDAPLPKGELLNAFQEERKYDQLHNSLIAQQNSSSNFIEIDLRELLEIDSPAPSSNADLLNTYITEISVESGTILANELLSQARLTNTDAPAEIQNANHNMAITANPSPRATTPEIVDLNITVLSDGVIENVLSTKVATLTVDSAPNTSLSPNSSPILTAANIDIKSPLVNDTNPVVSPSSEAPFNPSEQATNNQSKDTIYNPTSLKVSIISMDPIPGLFIDNTSPSQLPFTIEEYELPYTPNTSSGNFAPNIPSIPTAPIIESSLAFNGEPSAPQTITRGSNNDTPSQQSHLNLSPSAILRPRDSLALPHTIYKNSLPSADNVNINIAYNNAKKPSLIDTEKLYTHLRNYSENTGFFKRHFSERQAYQKISLFYKKFPFDTEATPSLSQQFKLYRQCQTELASATKATLWSTQAPYLSILKEISQEFEKNIKTYSIDAFDPGIKTSFEALEKEMSKQNWWARNISHRSAYKEFKALKTKYEQLSPRSSSLELYDFGNRVCQYFSENKHLVNPATFQELQDHFTSLEARILHNIQHPRRAPENGKAEQSQHRSILKDPQSPSSSRKSVRFNDQTGSSLSK